MFFIVRLVAELVSCAVEEEGRVQSSGVPQHGDVPGIVERFAQ